MVSQVTRARFDTALFCGIASFALFCCGCLGGDGPALGTVSGVVTLDGKPLENATVSFHPQNGRGSVGRTGPDGRYELTFLKGRKGATLGLHKVTISSQVWGEESRQLDYEGNPESGVSTSNVQARDEILPPKYHLREKSILSSEVKKGANEFDFRLESE